MWIGVDDTDSLHGGCTTFVCYRIVERVIEEGYDIIGYPRLVRLNPNIPWKTRGNGAISLCVGRGRGRKVIIGGNEKEKFYGFLEGKGDAEISFLMKIVSEIIEEMAFEDANTNPGFVICKRKPPPSIYWKGVRGILTFEEIKKLLDELGALYGTYGNGRGIIGATASVSWRPRDRTYEIITYRYKEKWGTNRFVDDETTIAMDKECRSTFDNYDYDNKVNRIVPNSPCPVLYGIRGEKPEELIMAKEIVRSEPYLGWMIFETNQGTDDHLQKKKIKEIKPFESVIVRGTVTEEPYTIPGGHVFFKLSDSTGSITCAAFEPTKRFRNIVRGLKEGDVVEVYGGVHEMPFTINLEKLRIIKLKDVMIKLENPVCKLCGKHMKSAGKGKGYRCMKCGSRADESEARFRKMDRKLREGFYEVPVCARRHLSKPLKRLTKTVFN
ncbi:MAG: DNA-binding protein [Thermoplasmata archaeon]|nr:MAG: DNA-binding protein [Thermoplasmata archaeon]